jgi:predicted RNA-binding Zn-ribbon protein involved in translation (DUF1610 family)
MSTETPMPFPYRTERRYSTERFLRMLGNAARLRCPQCGQTPIFVPWRKVRTLRDWFMPLDGCPHCGYAYEREPGYFLISIWAINYGAGALIGLLIYLVLDFWFKLPIEIVLLFTLLPLPVFNFWFARHSKAFYLAFDLFWDPHDRGGDDDDGGITASPGSPASPGTVEDKT